MNNDKMRTEFEKWIDSMSFEELDNLDENSAWISWQVSRAALVVGLPRLQGDAQYDGQEVIDALDAAGVAYK